MSTAFAEARAVQIAERDGLPNGQVTLDGRIPQGPIEQKWDRCRFDMKLVNPANRRKHTILIAGSGLAGAAAAATLGQQGYHVHCFSYHDTPRRAHSIAAQGGTNAAKNYRNDGDSVFRLYYDTVKGGDFRAREGNAYRLAPRGSVPLPGRWCPYLERDASCGGAGAEGRATPRALRRRPSHRGGLRPDARPTGRASRQTRSYPPTKHTERLIGPSPKLFRETPGFPRTPPVLATGPQKGKRSPPRFRFPLIVSPSPPADPTKRITRPERPHHKRARQQHTAVARSEGSKAIGRK
jgi:hypothetical protein